MSTLAIIPARGGSKGLPRKNARLLAGRPLLLHTIEHALAAATVDRVIVSTDDGELANMADSAGVQVVWRPAALAADDTPTLPVLTHALEQFLPGEMPAKVVTLQPTSPLRRSTQIDEAVGLLDDDCDAVVGVCYAEHSPYKMYRVGDGLLQPLLPNGRPGTPRQALPPVLRENGAVYVTWSQVLLDQQSIWGRRIRPYLMDAHSSLDIDTLLDLRIAEVLMAPDSHGETA